MDKLEYRLARTKARYEQEQFALNQIREIAGNPLIEFAAGIMFIRALTKDPNGKFEPWKPDDITRFAAAGGLGAMLTSIIMAQQISKSLPVITDSTMKLLPAIGGFLK